MTHLLLKYRFSGYIWKHLAQVFDLPQFPELLEELWTSWRNRLPSKLNRKAWDCCVSIMCWNLWKERNGGVFAHAACIVLNKGI